MLEAQECTSRFKPVGTAGRDFWEARQSSYLWTAHAPYPGGECEPSISDCPPRSLQTCSFERTRPVQ